MSAQGDFIRYDIMSGNNHDTVGGNNLIISSFKNHSLDKRIMIDRGILIGSTVHHKHINIDAIMPNYDEIYDSVDAIIITHGHVDHIGALAYDAVRGITLPPVYCTPVAQAFIQDDFIRKAVPIDKWPEFKRLPTGSELLHVGDITIGSFWASHSIPEACGLIIASPHGVIVHSGDFKTDPTVPVGPCYDGQAVQKLLHHMTTVHGTGLPPDLLAVDSTRAHVPGFTAPESEVAHNIRDIVTQNPDKRIVCAMFSSHLSRIVQMADIAADTGRALVIHGASITQSLKALVRAAEIYQKAGQQPPWLTSPINEVLAPNHPKKPSKAARLLSALIGGKNISVCEGDSKTAEKLWPSEQIALCTGTQGEPNAALYRAAHGQHAHLMLSQDDIVLLSASKLPDNKGSIDAMLNKIGTHTPKIYTDNEVRIHTSGHGRAADISQLVTDTKPHFILPIHGSQSLLEQHKKTLEENHKDHHIVLPALKNSNSLKIFPGKYITLSRIKNDGFIAVYNSTYRYGITRGHFTKSDEFGNIILPTMTPSPPKPHFISV